jgi:small multidrug resistance family-3 protein
MYGVVPTLQPTHFSRVYAVYGGVFIVLSLLWGWQVDGIKPDKFDWLGSLIALIGVMVMMHAPRN